MTERTPTGRRALLLAAGNVVVATATAGCLSSDGDESDDGEEPDRHPSLSVDGRHLFDSRPLELVEPDVEPFEGVAASANQGLVTYVHWHGDPASSHWHFVPVVPEGGERVVRSRFVDADERTALPLGGGEPFSQRVDVRSADGGGDGDGEASGGDLDATVDGDEVTFAGTRAGRCEVVFELLAGDDPAWESPPLPVDVGDDAGSADE